MICKFLCVPFLIKAQGNIFSYADSIFHTKNYALAAVEYERVIFENTLPAIQAQAALKEAGCLKILGRYDDAASRLDVINTVGLAASLRYKILFQSSFNSYLAHESGASLSKLEMLCHYYPDSARNKDVLLMKIFSLNELKQWAKADTVYTQFMLTYGRIYSSLSNPYLHIPKLKDPEKAEKLSAYLPFTGAGLFYAGDVKEGILNVILQLGFISFGAYSVLMERYITGILIGVGGYAAFYHGGVRRAKRLAEKYNERKTITFNTKVRSQLLQILKNKRRLPK